MAAEGLKDGLNCSFRGGADSAVIIGSCLSSDLVMSRAGLRSKTLLKAREDCPARHEAVTHSNPAAQSTPASGGLILSLCFVFQRCRWQLLPLKDSSDPVQHLQFATMIFCMLLLASLPEPSGAEVNPGRELPGWERTPLPPPVCSFSPFFASRGG